MARVRATVQGLRSSSETCRAFLKKEQRFGIFSDLLLLTMLAKYINPVKERIAASTFEDYQRCVGTHPTTLLCELHSWFVHDFMAHVLRMKKRGPGCMRSALRLLP